MLVIWGLPIHGVIIVVLKREYRCGWIEFSLMFKHKCFPFTYLGCPLYIEKKKQEYFDDWMGSGALSNILPPPSHYNKDKVKDFIHEGEWDFDKLSDILPPQVVNQIVSIPIGDPNQSDYAIWIPSEDGHFTTKSAYVDCINTREKNDMKNKIWHGKIPFEMTFLTWRLVQNKLPFYDTVGRFVDNIDSNCVCCKNMKTETINHVFLDSDVASYLWKNFGGPLGIDTRASSTINLLKTWWNVQTHNSIHNVIIHTLPILIFWEIWKHRCACKYGDQKKMWYRTMENHVWWNLKMSLRMTFPSFEIGNSWRDLLNKVESLRPYPKWKIVHWNTPNINCVKINTDGSFSSGNAGLGGIVRDHTGRMIMAFSIPSSCSSNNLAEALAARFGILWCLQQGFHNCYLELDSKLVVDKVRTGQATNLKIKGVVEDIIQVVAKMNCEVNHCYREANQVADALAKLVVISNEAHMYHDWRDIPKLAVGSYQLDKMQMPSIRIRYDKSIFFVS